MDQYQIHVHLLEGWWLNMLEKEIQKAKNL
jgi:hypothetical protein